MPTLTIDPYLTRYEERPDLVYDYAEWGTNRHGFPSHATKPGDGAQWDPTRVAQFAPYGVERSATRSLGYRRIGQSTFEGPHETSGVLIFRVALAGVTLSDARLRFFAPFYAPGAMFRLYGVAADNYTERFVSHTYSTTYTGLFHQGTWGKNQRRYIADSFQGERAHTVARVAWTSSAEGWQTSPNTAAILNEIIARQPGAGNLGWKSGNFLALVLAPNTPINDAPFAPDWDTYPGGTPQTSIGCDGWDGSGYDHAKIPQLDLTY